MGRAFLRRLHEHDPKLELFWHPLGECFLLYSRVRGNGQSDDVMALELNLGKKPPSYWLIEWLKLNDKYERGALGHEEARSKYLLGLENHENRRLAYWDKVRRDMSEDVAKHLKWCIDGRQSFTVDWGKRRYA